MGLSSIFLRFLPYAVFKVRGAKVLKLIAKSRRSPLNFCSVDDAKLPSNLTSTTQYDVIKKLIFINPSKLNSVPQFSP